MDLFVVRKYIMAKNIKEAIELDKKTEPQDIWIDEDWKKRKTEITNNQIGFKNV